MTLSSLHWFAISLMIGLLIGIERERRHPEGTQAIGVRTFALVALLGTFAAVMDNPVLTATVSAFVLGGIIVGYVRLTQWQYKSKKIGLTTEISAAIVFCLGYMTPAHPLLVVILAGGVLLVLIERKRIHTFSRDVLTRQEIESAVVLLIFILGILPYLPNEPIDPWGVVNLNLIGKLMALIASVQFMGYAMVRIFGQRLGMILMGFFGGLASNTAVFVNMPRMLKKFPNMARTASAAATLAVSGKLFVVILLLFTASFALFSTLLPSLLAVIVTAILYVLAIMYRAPSNGQMNGLPNPLDLTSIVWLTLFIAGILTLVALLQRYIGVEGVQLITLIGAMFELHGATLAIAMLYATGKLKLIEASVTIAIGVVGSFIAKIALLWSLSRGEYPLLTTIALCLMLVIGTVVFFITSDMVGLKSGEWVMIGLNGEFWC